MSEPKPVRVRFEDAFSFIEPVGPIRMEFEDDDPEADRPRDHWGKKSEAEAMAQACDIPLEEETD